jgi:hypothetical protein
VSGGGEGRGKVTTQTRWPILRVKAWFSSSEFGGSTGSEQFSSALSKGSAPPFVTHGCSWEWSTYALAEYVF